MRWSTLLFVGFALATFAGCQQQPGVGPIDNSTVIEKPKPIRIQRTPRRDGKVLNPDASGDPTTSSPPAEPTP